MMRKTYTIYLRIGASDSPITGFSQCQKTFALGAMAMADSFYGENHEFICKCDQNNDILGHVYPRKLHLN